MSNKWIFGFEELGHEYNDFNGKKCAELGEIAKGSLPVPSGFAV
jgi:phosphoenolpyruvate synthase/pyruvate phosphate dikinase